MAENKNRIAKSWNWGIIFGFFYESSLYDASGLYDFVEDYFSDSKFYRHMHLGIADVLDGKFKSFKQSHGSEELIQVLKASLAFPGVFKAVEAFDSLWFTGSAIYEIDILSAIKHCESVGYDEENIVIDVIVSGNPHLAHKLAQYYNAFGIAERTFEVQTYYQQMYGLLRAKAGHPGVDFRHVIGPNRDMPNKVVPIEFTVEEVKKQLYQGKPVFI